MNLYYCLWVFLYLWCNYKVIIYRWYELVNFMIFVFVNVLFCNYLYILCLNLFFRYESFKNCIKRLLCMYLRFMVKVNIMLFFVWINLWCMVLIRFGCFKIIFGVLFFCWRYLCLLNFYMYFFVIKIVFLEFKCFKNFEYWMNFF